MKRCPTCQSTYTDDSLLYCLTDGATLVAGPSFDAQATLPNLPQSTLRDDNRATLSDDNRPTLHYSPERGAGQPPAGMPQGNAQQHGAWNPAPAPWTPAQPFATPYRRRSYLPWIIAAAAVLVLGIIVTVIVASRRSSAETPAGNNSNNVSRPVNDNSGVPPANKNANQSANGNSNQSDGANTNSNQQEPTAGSPPTDSDLVLSQLTVLENEWNDANIRGDKAAVSRIVAEEFRGVGANGSVENKRQMLANLRPAPQIASLKLSDLKVSLAGNTAVVTGLNTATLKTKQVLKFRFTDTFLWRDGRWQAISSQASQVK